MRTQEMMLAMKGAKFLLRTHAANVSTSASTSLVVNAFEMPSKAQSYDGHGTLWALMLGGNITTAHASLSVAYLPPSTAATHFESLLPGRGQGWTAVLPANVRLSGSSATLTLGLLRGCAMVRVRSPLG